MAPSEGPPKRKWQLGWMGFALLLVLILNVSIAAAFTIEHQFSTHPEMCSSCHIMEDHVESYFGSEYMDHVHEQANVSCKDCHSDYSLGDQLNSVWQYVTGNYASVMQTRRVEDSMCLQCHISLEYHANRTDYLRRNPHLSHWPELRCTSCHMSHDEQVDYCSRCHDNGDQRMTGDLIIPRADNPWAVES